MKKKPLPTLIRGAMGLSAAMALSGCSLDFSSLFSGSQDTTTTEESVVAVPVNDLDRGREAFASGHYGVAISHLERHLARNPASVGALNGLGAAFDQLGRYDVAQRYYFRALDLAPDSAMTLANLGYSYQLQGRAADSVRVFELALNQDPNNSLARNNLPGARSLGVESASESAATDSDRTDGITPATSEEMVDTSVFAIDSGLLASRPALLEVVNGNGVRGIAGATARELDGNGFRVTQLDNILSYDVERSRIKHRPNYHQHAEQLLQELGMEAELIETEQLHVNADVRLVLGQDFARQVIVANDRLLRGDHLAAQLDPALRLEVANGNGINGMASRVRGYLQERGGSVVRLSNAEDFRQAATVLYYRNGQRTAAEQLLTALPLSNVTLQESDGLAPGIDARLLLGWDYVPYDAQS